MSPFEILRASEVLTTTQAAAELGISPQRIRALISAGRLRATRIGPRMLTIERKDLAAVRERKMGRPKKNVAI